MKTIISKLKTFLEEAGFGQATLSVACFAVVLFVAGCVSRPTPVAHVEAPAPSKILFSGISKDPLEDRSPGTMKAQNVVDEANRVWAAHKTDTASYLRAGRLINSALQDNEFATPEEEMRLAVMAMQHALLANDSETLASAALHWEGAYRALRKAPVGGKVECYLVALRRLGRDLPDELVTIAHPEIQSVLRSEL